MSEDVDRIINVVLPNGAQMLVRVTEMESDRAEKLSPMRNLSMEDLFSSLRGFAEQLYDVFHDLKPKKSTVEFGVDIALQSGRLVSLIASGKASGSLKVTLEW
jgi:hypothetical protein